MRISVTSNGAAMMCGRSAGKALLGISLLITLSACGSTVANVARVQGQGQGQTGASDVLGAGAPTSAAATAPGAQVPAGSGGSGGSTSGGGSIGGATGSNASGNGIPTGATVGGSTLSRAPLTVGIIVSKCSNCDILPGYVAAAHSEQDIWQALVNGLNARGGISGRKISPVFATIDTNNTDWNTMFQSVCSTFTQDHHVAVVLGASFGYNELLGQCLAKANVAWIDAGFGAGDEHDLATFPTHFNPNSPSDDVQALLAYTSAAQDGWLTTATKLGVMRDDCPNDLRVWNHTVLPYLQKNHFHVQDDEVLTCVTGTAGYGNASSQISNAELKMRSDGVDTVVIRDIPLVVFASDAKSQQWNPNYLSTDDGAKYEPYLTKDQLTHIHDAGWLPYQDLDTSQAPKMLSANQRDCLKVLQTGGLGGLATSEYTAYFRACSGGWLYADAVARAGGSVATDSVTAAIGGLGDTFLNPQLLEERTLFGPNKHTGPVVYQSNLYDTSCSCFRYHGPVRPLPTAGP